MPLVSSNGLVIKAYSYTTRDQRDKRGRTGCLFSHTESLHTLNCNSKVNQSLCHFCSDQHFFFSPSLSTRANFELRLRTAQISIVTKAIPASAIVQPTCPRWFMVTYPLITAYWEERPQRLAIFASHASLWQIWYRLPLLSRAQSDGSEQTWTQVMNEGWLKLPLSGLARGKECIFYFPTNGLCPDGKQS